MTDIYKKYSGGCIAQVEGLIIFFEKKLKQAPLKGNERANLTDNIINIIINAFEDTLVSSNAQKVESFRKNIEEELKKEGE